MVTAELSVMITYPAGSRTCHLWKIGRIKERIITVLQAIPRLSLDIVETGVTLVWLLVLVISSIAVIVIIIVVVSVITKGDRLSLNH